MVVLEEIRRSINSYVVVFRTRRLSLFMLDVDLLWKFARDYLVVQYSRTLYGSKTWTRPRIICHLL